MYVMLVPSMNCPICQLQLRQENTDLWICPQNHGSLITARFLQDIEQKAIHEDNTAEATHHGAIACPSCNTLMTMVNYSSTGIFIDACPTCHARWLDSGECAKIKHFKPVFTSEDLLFLLDIDLKMKEHHNPVANPSMPRHWGLVRGTRYGEGIQGILGAGTFGLAKGLIHSKHSRILVLTTLVIFGVLFWLVFLDATSFNK